MTDNHARYGWNAPEVGAVEGGVRGCAGGRTGLRVGFIGVGNMGRFSLQRVMAHEDIDITAICDVDKLHAGQAMDILKAGGRDGGVAVFGDHRALLAAGVADAVVISTPDHWHVPQAVDAMEAGLDVYVEKPLSLTVAGGRKLCNFAERTGRVCQTGTQQRSSREFRFAGELVRNGRLGKIREISVGIPPNNREPPADWQPMPVPATFDYDMWLGPAPEAPYHEMRCHYNFRFISDYSGGQMTNWGAHTLDIVQWALGADSSGPVQVTGRGVFPDRGLFDTALQVDVEWVYPGGEKVRCVTGRPHVEFVGETGRLEVGRGHIRSEPESLLNTEFGPDDTRLYESHDHYGNFLDCVRSRAVPVCPPETGHRSATVCHIGNIALKLGRTLRWDPEAERFTGDDEANAMLSRPERQVRGRN
ncbi:MAG: Gfo/Idh/MocA family oxidoreductase [Lentisphaerae bacterium]|nr:Gfo/Idh/MocA family oxidoreductase [Lentisphaerota bacterium]